MSETTDLVQFDYTNQAWLQNGRYISCGHPGECGCYGKEHAGEAVKPDAKVR